MTISKQGEEVRQLIEAERNGMLCTISKRVAGWPFGSITPFALTSKSEPLILISEIAEHTRNLRADARVSLLVQDSRALDDPQAGARVTLMGYSIPVSRPYLDDARRRYLKQFPNSAGYFDVHDFTLFEIKVDQVRFIGGFGEIHWLSHDEVFGDYGSHALNSSIDALAPHVDMICGHMNEDHADALRLYSTAFANVEADRAHMIHVDSLGFDLIAVREGHHKHLRIDFPERVTTTEEVRAIMVEMVRQARSIVAR